MHSFSSRRSSRAAFAVVATAALLVSACGGSNGTTDTTTSGSTSAAGTASGEAPTGGEVNIGGLVPLTGGGSEFGPRMQKAMEIAVKQVNDAGGANGKSFKLFVEDGQTEPDAAVRGAQKLINVNGVKAVLGTWSSAVTLAVAPIAIQAGVVHMNTSGANPITDLDDKDLVWRFQPPARLTGTAVAKAIELNGWKTAVAMARNDPSGTSTIESFQKEFEALGGKVVKTITYAPTQASYTTEVRQALDAKADVIFNSTYAPELSVMKKEAAAAGGTTPWVAPGWAVNKAYIETVGADIANGTYGVDSAPNVDGQAYKDFQADFKAADGSELLPSDTYVFSAYDMVIVLGLAMSDCKCDSGTALTDSIRKVTTGPGDEVTSFADGLKLIKEGKDINYQGASSNLDFDDKGDQIPAFGTYVVENGGVTLKNSYQLK